MSTNWSWFIIMLTMINILACFWLIRWNSQKRKSAAPEGDTTGHTWDEDLQEYNNPLPRWWLWLFYITIFFSLGYLVLYPGLGRYSGTLGWDQTGQYTSEMAAAETRYGPIFAAYAQQPIPALAQDKQAMASGQRLYLNYCATCHGSDAGGVAGFPNLTDKVWLWGDSPAAIKTSILDGRTAMMPPMGAGLPEEQVDELVAYVLSLNGREAEPAKVEAGKTRFATMCTFCHGADGTGNQAAGFPDLTNNNWLYGGSPGQIRASIVQGRNGVMPAHRAFLGEEKSHLLAAYVYSLSQ